VSAMVSLDSCDCLATCRCDEEMTFLLVAVEVLPFSKGVETFMPAMKRSKPSTVAPRTLGAGLTGGTCLSAEIRWTFASR
jgi:hypothetical protein